MSRAVQNYVVNSSGEQVTGKLPSQHHWKESDQTSERLFVVRHDISLGARPQATREQSVHFTLNYESSRAKSTSEKKSVVGGDKK